MQLHVDTKKSHDSVVFVRWSLSQKEIERLSQETGKKFVLISVAVLGDENNSGFEECRQLVPLEQMATYLTLRRPGKHMIYALAIYSYCDEDDKRLLQVDRYERGFPIYCFPLFDFNHDPKTKPFFSGYFYRNQPTKISVVVADQFFAKKPWDWKYVNSRYEVLPIDKCQFRGRRIFAYTIGSMLQIIRFVLGILAVVYSLFCGKRNINWHAPISFAGEPFFAINSGGSFFWRNSKGDFQLWRLFVSPIMICFIGLLVAVDLILALYFVAFLIFVSCAFVSFSHLLNEYKNRPLTPEQLAKREAENKQKEKAEEEYYQMRQEQRRKELEPLACQLVPKDQIGLATLPKDHQTVYLRFLDFKRRVCKPFAR